MYEFYITNLASGTEEIIFGRDLADAYKRANLHPAEWVVWGREYID